MKIKQCHIENFTVFGKQDIEFCDGINVIIGANGTGKSHLLKILYAMVQAVPGNKKERKDPFFLLKMIEGVFKPENSDLSTMIRSEDLDTPATFHLQLDRGDFSFKLRGHYGKDAQRGARYEDGKPGAGAVELTQHARGTLALGGESPGLFIPPNEVLAIYPGFAASYEKRELAFDQTYYDICKALAAAPLKQKPAILSRLILDFEEVLQGKVVQKGDRFYVQNKKTEKALEAHLLAEGHRKIATIVHLINNGSIDKNTVLFWDEPEANLNPRLIKHVALFLRELAKVGVQVFIATHDYLLTGELSLAAEYKTTPKVPIRFFALSRKNDGPVDIQSGETLADLQDNPILDEFAAHYAREQQAAMRLMKNGGAE